MNNRTYYFSLIFHCIFSEQNSLEPARIMNFLAPMIYVNIINRQTNLLNYSYSDQLGIKHRILHQLILAAFFKMLFHTEYTQYTRNREKTCCK